jgi:hypothetical protein
MWLKCGICDTGKLYVPAVPECARAAAHRVFFTDWAVDIGGARPLYTPHTVRPRPAAGRRAPEALQLMLVNSFR